eukprot:7786478-Prorocentrum_lima.AAC.1
MNVAAACPSSPPRVPSIVLLPATTATSEGSSIDPELSGQRHTSGLPPHLQLAGPSAGQC